MLVPYRLGLFSHLTISHCHQCFPSLFPPFLFLASISGAPKSRTNKIQPKAKTASMSGFTSKSRQKLWKVKDWRGEFVRICLMKMLVDTTQKKTFKKKTKNCAVNLDPGNAIFPCRSGGEKLIPRGNGLIVCENSKYLKRSFHEILP